MIQAPRLQQLSPSNAKLCLLVKDFWNQYPAISTNKHKLKILLALSGGADSTSMAIMLYLLQSQLNIDLSAVTINHQIRNDAHKDILFVKQLCDDLNIEFLSENTDVARYAHENKMGLEEAGRILRYKLLEKIRRQIGANYIAIAHNADDLCEDVLMRLCRGTAWPGLGGMHAVDLQRKLIRPILTIRRKQIENFLITIGLQWQTDTTNQDIAFTRNRFRHKIVPLFHNENPKFHKSINNLWSMANLDAEFWEEYLNTALQNEPWHIKEDDILKEISLGNKLLSSLSRAARLRMISKAIKETECDKNNLRADILFKIEKTWSSGEGNKNFYLTKSLIAHIKQRNIYIRQLKQEN